MRKMLFLLLLCVNLCGFAHEDNFNRQWRISTPVPYNEIGIDTLQKCIINHERDMAYVYSTSCERELAGLCLRAFYVWAKRYTGNDSLKLDVLELGRGFRVDKPFSLWAYEIDEDEEDENGKYLEDRELERANRYINEYPFRVVDAYECLGNEIFEKNTAVANVSIHPFGLESSITIKISALLPNSNNQDIWMKKEFWYIFRLKLLHVTINSWNEYLIKSIQQNPNFIIDAERFVNLSELEFVDFNWELYSIYLAQDEVIDFTNKSIYLTYKHLFPNILQ